MDGRGEVWFRRLAARLHIGRIEVTSQIAEILLISSTSVRHVAICFRITAQHPEGFNNVGCCIAWCIPSEMLAGRTCFIDAAAELAGGLSRMTMASS
jgi:hypothetical protein